MPLEKQSKTIAFDEYTYSLAKEWAVVLINGDISGLEEGEVEKLDKWLETIPSGGHWQIPEESHDDFKKDEVTGLLSDTFEMKYMVPQKETIIESKLKDTDLQEISPNQISLK